MQPARGGRGCGLGAKVALTRRRGKRVGKAGCEVDHTRRLGFARLGFARLGFTRLSRCNPVAGSGALGTAPQRHLGEKSSERRISGCGKYCGALRDDVCDTVRLLYLLTSTYLGVG